MPKLFCYYMYILTSFFLSFKLGMKETSEREKKRLFSILLFSIWGFGMLFRRYVGLKTILRDRWNRHFTQKKKPTKLSRAKIAQQISSHRVQ